MFVTSNLLKDLLPYYHHKLGVIYEAIEIENIFFLMAFFEFGCEKIDVRTKNIRLSESDLLRQKEIVKRLTNKEPIQYICGKVEFYDLLLTVSPDVLIPRPETAELIDLVLLKHQSLQLNILDIGTGSGCIPLALKFQKPNWTCTGIDISEKALSVAKLNSQNLKLDVNWLQKDILSESLTELNPFDLIISNPPYVLESDKIKMDNNVLLYEPASALFVPDNTPLLFYNRIIELAVNQLKKGGSLYFEIHEQYGAEVVLAMINAGFSQPIIVKDMQGKDRIVFAELL